jgi:hypothetical protein
MSENKQNEGAPAWLQLYLTRHMPKDSQPAIPGSVGRPSREVPVTRTTIYLTAKDKKILSTWQKYFGSLIGKEKVSIGEALSLLIRICDDRLIAVGGKGQFDDITELTRVMISGGEKSSD